jgi:hypothetical protein
MYNSFASKMAFGSLTENSSHFFIKPLIKKWLSYWMDLLRMEHMHQIRCWFEAFRSLDKAIEHMLPSVNFRHKSYGNYTSHFLECATELEYKSFISLNLYITLVNMKHKNTLQIRRFPSNTRQCLILIWYPYDTCRIIREVS